MGIGRNRQQCTFTLLAWTERETIVYVGPLTEEGGRGGRVERNGERSGIVVNSVDLLKNKSRTSTDG
jgi:hypothetical protein